MATEDPEFWGGSRGPRWRRLRERGRGEGSGRRSAGTVLNWITVALAAATVVGLIVLWPGKATLKHVPGLDFFKDAYKASVVSASTETCPGSDPAQPLQCVTIRARLLEGPDEGVVTKLLYSAPVAGTHFSAGDRILLVRVESGPGGPDTPFYTYLDHARLPSLWWLAAAFALAVVVLGRLRGLGALIGLAASFFFLLRFMLPAIIQGHSPVLVSLVASCAIAFLALYLAQGFGKVTTVALLGTVGALGVTALLGTLWVRLADFTGLGSEEAFVVQLGAANVDLVGLLLAGIIIGALGALDDMSVTQAAAVEELRRANPTMSRKAVYRSGLRIGRDHVASIVNTLVLAYAGASLPLMLVFLISSQPPSLVLNSESIAVEVVRALVGSIGLVACVPLTTWLAAYLMPPEDRPAETGEPAIPEEPGARGRHRAGRANGSR